MIILPIQPIAKPKNPPRQSKAFVAIRKGEATVYPAEGEPVTLPTEEAWRTHEKLNEVV